MDKQQGTEKMSDNKNKKQNFGGAATSAAKEPKQAGGAANTGEVEAFDEKEEESEIEEENESMQPVEGEVEQSFSSTISTKAAEFEDQVGELIRKRPLTVMAGALAVGFLATRFLSGKILGGVAAAAASKARSKKESLQ